MNYAGVLAETGLYRKMIREELSLPPNEPLTGRQRSVPYVFVGDDAFSLSRLILKLRSGTHVKGSIKRIFNYRLSRARRIVENLFGILSSVFRILKRTLVFSGCSQKKLL